jgi:hypothetical protein
VSPNSLLERDQAISLVELVRHARLPVVVPFDITDGAHLIWRFVVGGGLLESLPVRGRLSTCPRQPLVGIRLGEPIHDRLCWLESHLGTRLSHRWSSVDGRLRSY